MLDIVYFKRDLPKKISCDDDNTIPSSTWALRSSIWKSAVTPRTKCEKLPASYVFCQKPKRVKGRKTKEKLYLCLELREDKVICEASLLHDNERIAALFTDKLITKKAVHHKTYYKDFARIVKRKKLDIKNGKDEGAVDNSLK